MFSKTILRPLSPDIIHLSRSTQQKNLPVPEPRSPCYLDLFVFSGKSCGTATSSPFSGEEPSPSNSLLFFPFRMTRKTHFFARPADLGVVYFGAGTDISPTVSVLLCPLLDWTPGLVSPLWLVPSQSAGHAAELWFFALEDAP